MVISVAGWARVLAGNIGRMAQVRPLATQVLVLQTAVVVATIVAGGLLSFWLVREQLVSQYKERALSLAHVVASTPDIIDAFDEPVPSRTIQPIAEAIRRSSGASFVVVANTDGIRYSHPNPERIGERVSTDPSTALSGQDFVGVERGTLGVSVRAKVPIADASGKIIGIVSLGFLEEELAADLLDAVPWMGASVLLALALGLIGSIVLARRLRQQTFDLGPREIAALLEQREAMLHGIREGVVATDTEGRVTLANDEARRLLALEPTCVGRRIDEVISPGSVRDVLTGARPGADKLVLSGGRALVVNRTPVTVRGKSVGAVATLRDRTEIESALKELNNERNLAHALRAQAHEFYNKLHAVSGLIELGRFDDAVGLISRTALVHQELVDRMRERIGDPTLAALLLAKASVASERGVDFRLALDTRLTADAADPQELVTVMGNLVDNAMDAAAGTPDAWVEIAVTDSADGVTIRVRDSGPGIRQTDAEAIWREGFTTKRGTAHHGLGLALVRQVTERRGGWVRLTGEGPTEFSALLPRGVPLLR